MFQKINSYCIILLMAGIMFYGLTAPAVAADSLYIPNPTDSLQVKIPGMARLTDAKNCPNDSTTLCISWIGEYIFAVYKYSIGIVGILATVVMMWGGLRWLLAAGNPSSVSDAKDWITGALTGLVIAFTSYLILYQVNPSLTVFKPLRIGVVPKMDIAASDISYTSGGGVLGTTNIPSNPAVRDLYNPQLAAAAARYGVECTLLKAIMFTESAGNPTAVSPVGAIGLMQLMPTTASTYGFTGNLTDPTTNTLAAGAYVQYLNGNACNGSASNATCNISDMRYIIAAYNGGAKANTPSLTCPGMTYWQCDANSGYAETRSYVNKVLSNYNSLKTAGGC